MPEYIRGIDVERRPWQRRIEVYKGSRTFRAETDVLKSVN